MMTSSDIQILIGLIGGFLALLLGANAWFIKRLVTKLDDVAAQVSTALPTYSERMKGFSEDISGIKDDMKSMRDDFKNVSELQSRVAVLEFAYRSISGKSVAEAIKQ